MKLLKDKVNVIAPTADFPNGDLKDNSGSNDGVNLNRDLFSDTLQLMESIFAASGLVATGVVDSEYDGFQLFEAMNLLYSRQEVLEIGAWDMVSDSAIVVNGRVTPLDKITSITAVIYDDTGAVVTNLFNPATFALRASGVGSITLQRETAGSYDDAAYNDGGVNRGYIHITRLP